MSLGTVPGKQGLGSNRTAVPDLRAWGVPGFRSQRLAGVKICTLILGIALSKAAQ